MRRAVTTGCAVLVAAIAIAAATSSRADEPLLGTIDTEAARIEDEVPDTTASATVIPIQNQPQEGQTLADVLDDTVGVQVRRFGGLGDFATVSIRGSSPGQVGFFFDGVPLTRARSETVNLADFPIDELDRIEVYRGVAPLDLPGSALAGAVNLVSREPGDTPRFSLLAGGGSFGTRKAAVTGSAKHGDWSGILSASYLGSEGDFEFHDDNGTPLNPNDDETTRRKNNAFDAAEVLAKVRYVIDERTSLTGLQEIFINDQGVPGLSSFQSDDASLRDLRSLTYLRFQRDRLGDRPITLQSTGYFVFDREAFRDVDGDLGVGSVSTDNRTYSGGLDNHLAARVGTHEIEARLDAGGEVFSPQDDLAEESDGPNQARVRVGATIGDTFGLLSDRLILQPSFRYEHVHDDFGGTIGAGGLVGREASAGDIDLYTPRLGLRFDVATDLAFKANVGRYARAPNFSELFGNRGSVIGNPELDPEHGVNADVAVVATRARFGPLTRMRAEAAGFVSDVDDLIVLVQNSQRTAVPRNVASARVVGAELSVAMRAFEQLHLSLNYTFQNARDHSGIPARDGNHLPGRPEHALYTRAEYHLKGARMFYEMDLLASNFLDQANLRRVDHRIVHTVGVAGRLPWVPLELSFEAQNLGDDQIEDVAGFPLPGRAFFGSVRWTWERAAAAEDGAS